MDLAVQSSGRCGYNTFEKTSKECKAKLLRPSWTEKGASNDLKGMAYRYSPLENRTSGSTKYIYCSMASSGVGPILERLLEMAFV